MLKYRIYHPVIPDRTCDIWLDSSNPHQSVLIQFQGDRVLVDRIRYLLSKASGAFGHCIGDATSPIDLDYCLRFTKELQEFNPQIIEGQQLVKNYSSGIPKGAVT